MDPRPRKLAPARRRRRTTPAAPVAIVAAVLVAPAVADAAGWSARVGPVAGVIAMDSRLADYRWDTTPRPVWGLGGAIGNDRFAGGLRVWRAGTTQSTGIPGESAPAVRWTVTEALGELRLARIAGFRLLASASAGRLHLGWSPDRVTLDSFGVGEPLEVTFDPVTEWISGIGLSVRRPAFGGLELALGLERSWFRLDTAHRAGDEIVNARETFGHWTARIELSHRLLTL